MTSVSKLQKGGAAIRSHAYWSLLGLIIQRPDYGYGLLQRIRQGYGDALPLSSVSHVYDGIKALERVGLIEMYVSRDGRKRYRAVPGVERVYTDWLIAQIPTERYRSRLFAHQVAALEGLPDLGLEVIEAYERACLADESRMPVRTDTASGSLAVALTSEQARLAAQVETPWVNYARARFEELSRIMDEPA